MGRNPDGLGNRTFPFSMAKDPFRDKENSNKGKISQQGSTFKILYANDISFSDKIKYFLFEKNHRKKIVGFCLVETKIKPKNLAQIKSLFMNHSMHLACNAGECNQDSEGGVSTRTHTHTHTQTRAHTHTHTHTHTRTTI